MIQDTDSKLKDHIHTPEHIDPAEVLEILDTHNNGQDGLISILETIQDKYGYLPETALRTVGDKMACSLVDIYGVATFYRSFSLQPRGKHLISACLGTACHVRNAPKIVEELERLNFLASRLLYQDKR